MNDLTEQYLTFRLDQQKCALSVHEVREVIEYRPITVLPGMADWVSGVIDLRGDAIPLIDLKYKIGMRKSSLSEDSAIIITQPDERKGKGVQVGLLVDGVYIVDHVNSDEIQTVPVYCDTMDLAYVNGVVPGTDGFTLLLDLQKVINGFTRGDNKVPMM